MLQVFQYTDGTALSHQAAENLLEGRNTLRITAGEYIEVIVFLLYNYLSFP